MNVDLLCLDAGNVIVFLHHARLAKLTGLDEKNLVVAEGKGKRAIEDGTALDVPWSRSQIAGWRQWGRVMATMLHHAGLERSKIEEMLESLCIEHASFNLWSRVPDGLASALTHVRESGARIAVVSNSEGALASLFERIGILSLFDDVIDSGLVGVEKPDPRIFALALEKAGASPNRAVHVGDTFATDVVGARAAGIPVFLVDPFGHYEGLHLDVPRAKDAIAVANDIVKARKNRR